MTDKIHQTREQWLTAALWTCLDAHFTAAGHDVPAKLRVACGFPSTHALARKNTRIGECWSNTMSKDGTYEVLISPLLDDPIKILGVLVHEVCHAVDGMKNGHKAPFRKIATSVGLTGKMTSTGESDELKVEMTAWSRQLGEYPHAAISQEALDPETGKPIGPGHPLFRSSTPRQSTRMLKLSCGGCGCIIRTARKWLLQLDGMTCTCGGTFASAMHRDEVG